MIAKLENENLLNYIELLLQQPEVTDDWGNHLTNSEKTTIQEGLNDLNKGLSMPYEDFKKRMEKRYQ